VNSRFLQEDPGTSKSLPGLPLAAGKIFEERFGISAILELYPKNPVDLLRLCLKPE
jgi:hypothetical protein